MEMSGKEEEIMVDRVCCKLSRVLQQQPVFLNFQQANWLKLAFNYFIVVVVVVAAAAESSGRREGRKELIQCVVASSGTAATAAKVMRLSFQVKKIKAACFGI
ncbi:hypothetical protein Tsp_00066 [Trichinella spiralis]|uniref:hypothetical protein n=1 Tax=Trichinella spiralis TaxID=6334 RepID=UPI0001EFBC52|nr:hypothetical protein Tsp_00066 [Trichinella spiralis]